MRTSGLVSLVGAGPGDPELITLRGARRLAEADLVLYDALVSRELPRLAPRARRFLVGKRRGHLGLGQDAIHALLIRWSRRGKRVVRLKCGDPFVFGRGGEEVRALIAAGVAVEVIPGVSTATAAAVAAGIPLTQRGVASAFVTISGHSPTAYGELLDALPVGSATVVVLMGFNERVQIAARLVAGGWPAETPSAVVFGATTPLAVTWEGTLGELASARAPLDETGVELPATIVIGDVVALIPGGWLGLGRDRDDGAEQGGAHVCTG